jgi:nitrogen fixation protein NifB
MHLAMGPAATSNAATAPATTIAPMSRDRLDRLNLRCLTVTLNAMDPEVGGRIYSHVLCRGMWFTGPEGARILIAKQVEGLEIEASFGLTIKVNTVFILGVNEEEIPLIARRGRDLGVAVMNIMPLILQAEFAGFTPPTPESLDEFSLAYEKIIGQFKHWRHCLAEAVGRIGDDIKSPETDSEIDVPSD